MMTSEIWDLSSINAFKMKVKEHCKRIFFEMKFQWLIFPTQNELSEIEIWFLNDLVLLGV